MPAVISSDHADESLNQSSSAAEAHRCIRPEEIEQHRSKESFWCVVDGFVVGQNHWAIRIDKSVTAFVFENGRVGILKAQSAARGLKPRRVKKCTICFHREMR